jgi:hypothetical protein
MGLLADYRIGPVGQTWGAEARITVWPASQAGDEHLRNHLTRLLDGLVAEPAIVVEPRGAAAEARPEPAPQSARAPELERAGRVEVAPFRRHVLVSGLATAAALLTCIAAVLNLGPFARPPHAEGVLAVVDGQAAPIARDRAGFALSGDGLSHANASPARTGEPKPTVAALTLPSAEHEAAVSQPGGADTALATAAAAQPHTDQAERERTKPDAIVGVWAPDTGTCSARDFRGGALPTVMNQDGAWAGDTFCMFTKQQQTQTGWRVVAKCQNPRERWTSNVRLTVNENRLIWTSKRGTQAYTRCAPDVLMAQAR